MANLNKVMLIGRLTRDPEIRTFANGGKVAKIGFAVNNRRKNAQSGQWEDEPVFLEVEAFNRLDASGRQLADQVEQSLRKGNQAFIEGHLRFDQWTSQEGQKRQKLVVVLDNLQFLDPRGEGNMGPRSSGPPQARRPMGPPEDAYDPGESAPPPMEGGVAPRDEDIPF